MTAGAFDGLFADREAGRYENFEVQAVRFALKRAGLGAPQVREVERRCRTDFPGRALSFELLEHVCGFPFPLAAAKPRRVHEVTVQDLFLRPTRLPFFREFDEAVGERFGSAVVPFGLVFSWPQLAKFCVLHTRRGGRPDGAKIRAMGWDLNGRRFYLEELEGLLDAVGYDWAKEAL
jgi:hypothetical protein